MIWFLYIYFSSFALGNFGFSLFSPFLQVCKRDFIFLFITFILPLILS